MRRRLRLPKPGEDAPNFDLSCIDGGTVGMRDVPKPLLLIFLRHLA
jgi:peroxiredoxin